MPIPGRSERPEATKRSDELRIHASVCRSHEFFAALRVTAEGTISRRERLSRWTNACSGRQRATPALDHHTDQGRRAEDRGVGRRLRNRGDLKRVQRGIARAAGRAHQGHAIIDEIMIQAHGDVVGFPVHERAAGDQKRGRVTGGKIGLRRVRNAVLKHEPDAVVGRGKRDARKIQGVILGRVDEQRPTRPGAAEDFADGRISIAEQGVQRRRMLAIGHRVGAVRIGGVEVRQIRVTRAAVAAAAEGLRALAGRRETIHRTRRVAVEKGGQAIRVRRQSRIGRRVLGIRDFLGDAVTGGGDRRGGERVGGESQRGNEEGEAKGVHGGEVLTQADGEVAIKNTRANGPTRGIFDFRFSIFDFRLGPAASAGPTGTKPSNPAHPVILSKTSPVFPL